MSELQFVPSNGEIRTPEGFALITIKRNDKEEDNAFKERGVALTNSLELAIEKMDASSAFSLARGMVIHRPGIEWNAAALERYIRRHELSSFGDHAVAAAGGVVGTLVTLAIAKGIRGLWAKYRGP